MAIWLWSFIGFLSGSVMYAHLLARIARVDLRTIGDGNPGAFNLWQAAGYRLGMLAVVLDFMKGFAPVAAALWLNVIHPDDPAFIPIVAAPVLGHMFSPMLRFRGGKGIAVTFGVWSALTAFEVTLVYAVILAVLLVTGRALNGWRPTSSEADSFMVVLGMLAVSVWLHQRSYPAAVFWGWCANIALMIWAHRAGLRVFLKKWI
jgi:acyl-phosphate glycerol 3-phosphate acyltransferase